MRRYLLDTLIVSARLFGGDLNDVSLVVPTVRLVNLGWAF